MSRKLTDRSTTLRVISAAILIVGLLSAIVIYWNAALAAEIPLGAALETGAGLPPDHSSRRMTAGSVRAAPDDGTAQVSRETTMKPPATSA